MKNNQRNNRTYRIVLMGIFTAIIILQNFVPFLGYIPVGPLSLTVIHITVIITAIVLGPVDGAIIGGIWGMTTFIRAFTFPSSPIAPIVFTNPLISIVPRILIGLFAGYAYRLLRRIKRFDLAAMSLSAILGSLTNTVLVLGLIYLFYRVPYANYYQMDVSKLLPALLFIVCTNGLAEAFAAAVISPLVAKPLLRIRGRKNGG
ncbi:MULTISPECIES: ECF transporter S component [unclassified Sporolactobacillus]|uniref:ECF transporter S component n=1 Tax=unclassified Sporolactobacillus TaxID=2628533 RepID=UPI0023685F76|nr:ECF transporter S component [Sporolactobacillus sp. CQH2019]MDD9149569.1 ECF transporter S component [Sporolactobacillus sp. CQH2019]